MQYSRRQSETDQKAQDWKTSTNACVWMRIFFNASKQMRYKITSTLTTSYMWCHCRMAGLYTSMCGWKHNHMKSPDVADLAVFHSALRLASTTGYVLCLAWVNLHQETFCGNKFHPALSKINISWPVCLYFLKNITADPLTTVWLRKGAVAWERRKNCYMLRLHCIRYSEVLH